MMLYFGLAFMKMHILERKCLGAKIIVQNVLSCEFKDGTWLNKERMLQWLDEVNIFQEFFGVDMHVEVLKLSNYVLRFLYKNKRLEEP